MTRAAAALYAIPVLAVGCGRVSYEIAGTSGPDSGATQLDAGPFGPPTLIAELSDSTWEEDDPFVTADGLELFFSSNRPPETESGLEDLWVSRRVARDDPWGPPQHISELSAIGEDDNAPTLSEDALTLWFGSTRAGGAHERIYVARRAARNDPWSAPTLVPELDAGNEQNPGSLSADGRTMWIEARLSDSDVNVYATSRAGASDPWAAAVPIAELTTPGWDEAPTVTPDGLAIVFVSNRPGGSGARDLWEASRSDRASPFGAPRPIAEANTAGREDGPWISADRAWLLFSSVRSGRGDLFEARR